MLARFFALLSSLCANQTSSFDYDLHLLVIPGTTSRVMVCCHGYGGNYQVAEKIKDAGVDTVTLVGFNFPDHDIKGDHDPKKLSFGTICELLPAFHVLKKLVIEQGHEAVDLYGRSAGGAAVINLIATLNRRAWSKELRRIGICQTERRQILAAIQRGTVILDVPLKSVEEIVDYRGSTVELEILAKQYRTNNLRPIDALDYLRGLPLNVILYFQQPDEIIFNRDDQLFIDRLKVANSLGKTSVVIGHGGSHSGPHPELWQFYLESIQ